MRSICRSGNCSIIFAPRLFRHRRHKFPADKPAARRGSQRDRAAPHHLPPRLAPPPSDGKSAPYYLGVVGADHGRRSRLPRAPPRRVGRGRRRRLRRALHHSRAQALVVVAPARLALGVQPLALAASGATPAAKVSPTPSDTAKASGDTVETGTGPVTVIDVGTHGPIAPAFLLPPPDPLPPRRSLSAKHIRFAERIGRIRSMRRGGSSGEAAAAEDDVFVECRRGGEVGEEGTLWTKTIILGERCRVPSAGDEGEVNGGGDDGTVPWRSYRPRQPRSVPVTRSNSFAGVGSAGARRLADPRF